MAPTLAPPLSPWPYDRGYHHNALGIAARACSAMFPEIEPTLFLERTAGVGVRPVVLHLGDSMLEGTGVGGPSSPGRTFVARLQALDPDVAHVNAGLSGTGPDAGLAVARSWLERLRVRAVVQYLYLGNDREDLAVAYPCCDLEPLLAGDGAGSLRCPGPRPAGPLKRWAIVSATPWLLRLLSEHSVLARHLVALIEGRVHARLGRHVPSPDLDGAAIRSLLEPVVALAGALALQEVPLSVVVLPERAFVEHPQDPLARALRERHARVVREARARGLHALDGTGAFPEGGDDGPSPLGFIQQPDGAPDDHFDDVGHARMAAWLHERLPRPGP